MPRERKIKGVCELSDGINEPCTLFGRVDEFEAAANFRNAAASVYAPEYMDESRYPIREYWMRVCICADGQREEDWLWHAEIEDGPGRGRFKVFWMDL